MRNDNDNFEKLSLNMMGIDMRGNRYKVNGKFYRSNGTIIEIKVKVKIAIGAIKSKFYNRATWSVLMLMCLHDTTNAHIYIS